MINKIKTYIDENRFLKISLILIGIVSLIVVTRLAIQEKKMAGVKAFHVSISYKDKTKRLISSDYIKDEVRKSLGYNVERIKIKDLDIMKIEDVLDNNDFIERAEVYLDGKNVLRVELVQKNPIVRINNGAQKFYLDDKGEYLSLSPVATVRVPVVTGDIKPYTAEYNKIEGHQFQDIFELATKIYKDDFLTSLIEQVHIEKNGDYLLIPKIGKEKIMLGSVYDLEEKMYKLKVFYKEGLTRLGWGKYAYLDLKYEEQVVVKSN
ncbi:cell division protein FtsQ/DivIB [Portibacter lacus]|uniref:Cell division protein FtsQ n=1 Tax=Portibacter lacus TaxID=1099794 RepID=A0AA37WE37_9BACT|nr:hypothetical protein [Portibacter lacus]GLR15765.1 hypothetical protein GCM10007940_03800 [Portibacter lacus]